jgi:hypothetical protein
MTLTLFFKQILIKPFKDPERVGAIIPTPTIPTPTMPTLVPTPIISKS